VTPVRIDASRAEGTVRIEWADGHTTAYDAPRLRWLCPCEVCTREREARATEAADPHWHGGHR
jgi:DUF971 family protein